METRCKFSINCENENPKDPPIAYCAFSSDWGEIVTCKGKQEDMRCCPFWSGLATRIQ